MINYINTTLISTAFIKQYSPVMKNVDDSLLLSHIQESQNIDLRYLIGDDLFELIISQYNDYIAAGGASAPNPKDTYIEQRLLDLREQFKPFLLYRTLWNAKYSFATKITNKGVTEQSSDNSENVEINMIDRMGKDWKNKSENYMKNVIKFILDNASLYPEYMNDEDCATGANRVFKNPIKFL